MANLISVGKCSPHCRHMGQSPFAIWAKEWVAGWFNAEAYRAVWRLCHVTSDGEAVHRILHAGSALGHALVDHLRREKGVGLETTTSVLDKNLSFNK